MGSIHKKTWKYMLCKRSLSLKNSGSTNAKKTDENVIKCLDCNKTSMKPNQYRHGRRICTCKQCASSRICPHGTKRSRCKPCRGSQICKHNKIRSRCKPCGVVVSANTIREDPHAVPLDKLKESMRQCYIATLVKAPELFDFFHPSENRKNGELMFIVGSLAL